MRDELDVEAWLNRLRLLAIVVPLACIAALHLLMKLVLDRLWPQHTVIIGWVVGALGLMAFALAMFLLIEHGHRLLSAQNEARLVAERQLAVLEERNRIAREMHDSLAQVLGATHLQLRALRGRPDTPESLRPELDEIAGTCRSAYADVREAILGLRQHVDGERSWLDGIENYLRSYERSSGLTAELDVADGFEPHLSPAAEVQLIRVVQEALTNVRKHAQARHVWVSMAPRGQGVRLIVADDGRGFDARSLPAHNHQGGFGMTAMRERVESVQGSLSVDSVTGKGTRVIIDLPDELPTEARA